MYVLNIAGGITNSEFYHCKRCLQIVFFFIICIMKKVIILPISLRKE